MIDAGFNKMPVRKAKKFARKINDLESQSAGLQKISRCFLKNFFVHKQAVRQR
jgi:hypothetical protein